MEVQIRKRVAKSGSYLNGKDWDKIVVAQNKRFAGKEIKAGEALVNGKSKC